MEARVGVARTGGFRTGPATAESGVAGTTAKVAAAGKRNAAASYRAGPRDQVGAPSGTTLPMKPQMSLHCQQMSLAFPLPFTSFPLEDQMSLCRLLGSHLCWLYQPPGHRPTLQSPLPPCLGPLSLVHVPSWRRWKMDRPALKPDHNHG
ncbi:UNVERIFIED_CONTAM: hypothetical protein FKN15_063957 [Acipenser sinensis]